MLVRWPLYLIYSVFLFKGFNSFVIRSEKWSDIVCLHPLLPSFGQTDFSEGTPLGCYQEWWYFTFSMRFWGIIVSAILLLYEKLSSWSVLNKWVCLVWLTFWVYEFAEYWMIYNKTHKAVTCGAMIVLIALVSVLHKR